VRSSRRGSVLEVCLRKELRFVRRERSISTLLSLPLVDVQMMLVAVGGVYSFGHASRPQLSRVDDYEFYAHSVHFQLTLSKTSMLQENCIILINLTKLTLRDTKRTKFHQKESLWLNFGNGNPTRSFLCAEAAPSSLQQPGRSSNIAVKSLLRRRTTGSSISGKRLFPFSPSPSSTHIAMINARDLI
jgi:hypothetical protein